MVNPSKTLLTFAEKRVLLLTGLALDRVASKYRKTMLDKVAAAASLAEEVISSIRNAHAFGTQKQLVDLYDGPNAETEKLGKVSAALSGVGLGSIFFIVYCAYSLAFFQGTNVIEKDQANAGQVITAFFSVLIGAFALSDIAPQLQAFAHASGAASHLYTIIDRVPCIDSLSNEGEKPAKVGGTIELRDVSFVYPARPNIQVLHNFTATFPKGKTTAVSFVRHLL